MVIVKGQGFLDLE